MRFVGIDPGAATGMACMDVEADFSIQKGSFIGSATVRASVAKKLNRAQRDGTLYDRISGQVADWHPNIIVIEEPADVRVSWGKHRTAGGGGASAAGTLFRLGAHYGIALAAARQRLPDDGSLASYYVTNRRGERGWMPGEQWTKNRHNVAVSIIQMTLASIHAPTELPDDELMACGLILTHLDRLRHGVAA
jgi:hypothetical protein